MSPARWFPFLRGLDPTASNLYSPIWRVGWRAINEARANDWRHNALKPIHLITFLPTYPVYTPIWPIKLRLRRILRTLIISQTRLYCSNMQNPPIPVFEFTHNILLLRTWVLFSRSDVTASSGTRNLSAIKRITDYVNLKVDYCSGFGLTSSGPGRNRQHRLTSNCERWLNFRG